MNNKKFKNSTIRLTVLSLCLVVIMAIIALPKKAYAFGSSKEVLVIAKGLSESDKDKVRSYYDKNIETDYVTIEDFYKYFGESSVTEKNLVSSVYIKTTSSGGVKVSIKTPENITEIKDYQYSSAAVTAGLENCEIEVIATRKATGHAALAGIYKAAFKAGLKLDDKSIKNGINELKDVNDAIKDNKNVDPKKIVKAINDTKSDIAEEKSKNINNNITINFIINALNNNLNNNGIKISKDSVEKIANTLKPFADNIDDSNLDKYKSQLNNLKNNLVEKLKDVKVSDEDLNFLQKILKAIADFFRAIWNFLVGLFS